MSGRVDKVSLESVVDYSEFVIVARPAEPPERRDEIDITPPGREPSSEFPPFTRVRPRYIVEEVLYSRSRADKFPPLPGEVRQDDTPALGEVIEVDEAAYEYDLGVHRDRHVDKEHKITLHEVYDPEETPSGSRLVFLRRVRNGWRFAVDPGEEGIGLRARVEKLLAGRS